MAERDTCCAVVLSAIGYGGKGHVSHCRASVMAFLPIASRVVYFCQFRCAEGYKCKKIIVMEEGVSQFGIFEAYAAVVGMEGSWELNISIY